MNLFEEWFVALKKIFYVYDNHIFQESGEGDREASQNPDVNCLEIRGARRIIKHIVAHGDNA